MLLSSTLDCFKIFIDFFPSDSMTPVLILKFLLKNLLLITVFFPQG